MSDIAVRVQRCEPRTPSAVLWFVPPKDAHVVPWYEVTVTVIPCQSAERDVFTGRWATAQHAIEGIERRLITFWHPGDAVHFMGNVYRDVATAIAAVKAASVQWE
jgi:hypothetical protein